MLLLDSSEVSCSSFLVASLLFLPLWVRFHHCANEPSRTRVEGEWGILKSFDLHVLIYADADIEASISIDFDL